MRDFPGQEEEGVDQRTLETWEGGSHADMDYLVLGEQYGNQMALFSLSVSFSVSISRYLYTQ